MCLEQQNFVGCWVFWFFIHTNNVSVVEKYSCEKNQQYSGKIPSPPTTFAVTLFQLVLLVVDFIFASCNMLIVAFLSLSGFTMVMSCKHCKSFVLCHLQIPPYSHTLQIHPSNQLLRWFRRYCGGYCSLWWFLWWHWHHCRQECEAVVQKITSAWLKNFVLGVGASPVLQTCFIPSLMLLGILESPGGSEDDEREGILFELMTISIDPLTFFVVMCHTTKWVHMSRMRH